VTEDYLASLDRRLTDLDFKLVNLQRDYQRDYTQLEHAITEVTNRVNNGLSPSVNQVRKENSDNKLSISDLAHVLDKTVSEMKSIVRESADLTKLMITNFEQHKLKPVEEEVGLMKKTFIYGLVGAVIVVLGQKGINVVWDKITKADKPGVVSFFHHEDRP